MGYQYGIKIKELAIILLLISQLILTEQQESCLLPDGIHQSTCVRLHYCDQLWNIIKQYNVKLPQHIAENINAYKCNNSNFYCCPDDAIIVTTTTTTTTPTTTTTSIIPPPFSIVKRGNMTRINEYSVWTALKDHQNYNLINEPSCGISTQNRIVGGSNAELIEFPWAVLLGYEHYNGMEWGCGGSLISKQFVLTAAHCILHSLKIVRLGEHTISTEKDCDLFNACADPVQDIKIETMLRHNLYKTWLGKRNDIGLIKLESPADLTKNNVKTICLPITEDSDIEKVVLMKRPMIITGWGRIETGTTADILQKAYVNYVESNDCAAIYAKLPNSNIEIFPTNFCAGGHNNNKTDSCKGDSGGSISAFVSIDGRPKMTIYGVVATGLDCKRTDLNYPGIYTNLKHYLNWILDNMSQ